MWLVRATGEVHTGYWLGVLREPGRPRGRWKRNIKMDLQEVGWGHGLDCSGSGHGQVADSCECGNEN